METIFAICIITLVVYLDFVHITFQLKIERDYGSMQIDVLKVFSLIGKTTEST